jgi:predicted glycosyl hydrolase (DUF1957 family)
MRDSILNNHFHLRRKSLRNYKMRKMPRVKRKRRRKRKRIRVRRKRRRVMVTMMRRSKSLRSVLLKLSRNLMSSMRTIMMSGLIEMRVRTINKHLIMTWLKMRSCQNSRMNTRKRLMS